MERRTAVCIVNPAAGKRTATPADLARSLEVLRDAGFDLRIVETGVPEPTAATLASEARRDGVRSVFVAGGDGTVAPAANALLDTGVALGILPFGSFMNIANALDLPLQPVAAARVIAQRRVRLVDVGEVNGHPFFEAGGVGLDADAFAAYHAMEHVRWRTALRRVARWLTRRTHDLTIVADGKVYRHRALQVLVTNGRYYVWSFPVVADAAMDDGRLDVAVFPRMGRLALMRFLFALWRGRRPPAKPVVYRAREVHLSSPDPVPAHADGYVVGMLPLTFRCRVGALAVYLASGGERPEDARALARSA